jgi:exosortase A
MNAQAAHIDAATGLALGNRAPFAGPLAKVAAATYVGLVGWLLAPTLSDLHRLWTDSYTYSHGYLIVLLAALLALRAERRAPLTRFVPSVVGLALLALTSALLVAGRASQTLVVEQMAVPALLLAAFWAIAGWRNTARFFWPVAYLYFAISFWDVLIAPLQSLTTFVASSWVRSLGVPAFIDGNWIHIPSGTFQIAGGCSGLSFLMVGLALAAYYGLSYYTSWTPRIALLLFATVLSLVANWVRVAAIILIGHATEMQHYLVRVDHYYFGWLLFAAALVPLYWFARGLERRNAASAEILHLQGMPLITVPPRRLSDSRRRWRHALGALAFASLASAAWLGHRVAARPALDPPAQAAAFASPLPSGWRRGGDWNDTRRPVFAGAAAETAAWFERGDDVLGVYVAHYAAQSQGREIVYYANRPQGAHAQVLARTLRSVTITDGSAVQFVESQVEDAAQSNRLVWFAMHVSGRWTSSDLEAKLYQVLGAIAGRRDAEALVLSASCAQSCEAARALLADSAGAVVATLDTALDAGLASQSMSMRRSSLPP